MIHAQFRFGSRSITQVAKPRQFASDSTSDGSGGWAAALETIDFALGENLKHGGGDQDWKRFFLLAASAIAVKEDSPPIPGTPQNEKDLAQELRKASEILNAIEILRGLPLGVYSAKRAHTEVVAKGVEASVYLVILDMRDRNNIKSKARAYAKEDLGLADRELIEIEKEFFGDPKQQVLRFSVDKVENIKPAYPAYFLDAHLFAAALQEFINTGLNPQREPPRSSSTWPRFTRKTATSWQRP